ncbi:MAG: hypothetical protein ABI824_13010 [Acidobacteriota bacterium]
MMDNKTFGYLGLGAVVGFGVAALLTQRERMGLICGRCGDDLSEYRRQSGEGSGNSARAIEKHDKEMFRAEVER